MCFSVYSCTFDLLYVYDININFLYCFINYNLADTCYNVCLERFLLNSEPSVHSCFMVYACLRMFISIGVA
jgi:hypothetical protein